ncbi:MAG TPA: polysaccharide deacetylase family protein [Vicinamibacterales bacterium]|nr:polysaccharide deacetylase family protein [Vicinamibacterales bacterium]
MVTASSNQPLAAVHLDLDGARHIYRAHGWTYDPADDPLFESGLRGALDLLARTNVTATLFVVAEDVFDAPKRALLRDAVAAGHEIASHSLSHGRLTGLDEAGKRREIAESRVCLASELGVDVRGFRAPGFHIDRECLELVNESGYAYDSSMLVATPRVAPQPHRPLPGQPLYELPVPSAGPFSFPFHPSYSLVLGHWYFRAGLTDFRRRRSPLVLLFHLTDFADPLPRGRIKGWQQRLFTLSHLTADHKRAQCASMLDLVRRHFTIASTSRLLSECTNGSHESAREELIESPREESESASAAARASGGGAPRAGDKR